ncbi:MAG: DNA repair protein RecO [Acidimicrobiia bacterium]|nr:DNA repair protein RecO [bacterium]MXZ07020.1 DNA repair protein RecO [Acidimicrobiia bacterium]MCY3652991.1 DNA repair protein RecO [bacterium]MDE0644367.1 DNA repair protein RecO [bacterium]MYD03420.1 DNA repair protein RecO [Acidimicrobiia bacterium]
MSIRHDQGIVLRGYPFGEADRVVVILSPNHGQVRAVAKGVRRTTSRFGARLEPLTHVDLVLYQGRSLATVTQVSVIEAFPKLRQDLDAVMVAGTMAKIIGQVVVDDEPSHRVFLVLLRGLRALEEGARGLDLAASFLLKVADVIGQTPALENCAACGAGTGLDRFSLAGGGLICRACDEGGTFRLRDGLPDHLAGLLAADLSGFTGTDSGLAAEAVGLARRFLEYHLEAGLTGPILGTAWKI